MKIKEAVQMVFFKNGNVLLEKRWKQEDNYAGLWFTPGGHVENGEQLEKAVEREAMEELGIIVTEMQLIGSFKDFDLTSKNWYELHYFLCKKWKGKIKGTTEQEKLEWKKISDLEKLKMAEVDRKAIRIAAAKNLKKE